MGKDGNRNKNGDKNTHKVAVAPSSLLIPAGKTALKKAKAVIMETFSHPLATSTITVREHGVAVSRENAWGVSKRKKAS
ncbi:MAG: hypothetical protein O2807_04740 [bacterium]|nr:hypothetical protein [bacterium]